jgi:hypothetical protein
LRAIGINNPGSIAYRNLSIGMTERLDIGRKSRFTPLTRAAVQPGPPIRKTIRQITQLAVAKYANTQTSNL